MLKNDLAPRLVHVLRNDALGGAEQSTFEVAQYLASQGIEQRVIILSPIKGGISKTFTENNIPVTAIPFTKTGTLAFIFSYVRFLKLHKPEVHLVTGAFGLHALLAILARAAGVRRSWTYLVMSPASNGLSRVTQFLMGQIARPFTAGEISITNYLRVKFNKTMHLPLSRIHVIYRWRDIANIASRADAERKKITSTSPVIITIGRLDWMKDLPNLIAAFVDFLDREPDALFYIVGDGPLLQTLQDHVASHDVSEKIIFLGHRRDVAELLGRSDIFIFSTSPIEGLGSVMIEAMASGTPMICTDVGPCREVMGDGVGGILVPPGDPKALSHAMSSLWKCPDDRKKQAAAARKFAYERYTSTACGEKLLRLLFDRY